MPFLSAIASNLVPVRQMSASQASRSLIRRVLAAVVAACLLPAVSQAATEYVEGDVIVTFKSSANVDRAKDALGRKSLSFARRFARLSAKRGRQTGLVRHTSKTTAQLIEELKNDPTVETVEPNYLRRLYALPNDSRFKDMWGLRNTGQSVDGTTGTAGADIKFVEAWSLARLTDNEIVVGVIDTGVEATHPDLVANMWVNPAETKNGVDDDGNGYIDDQYGYDFASNDADPTDADYHGTHVAGTVAAVGNNGTGVVGVNYRAKIMALKVSSNGDSISTSAVIEALEYATLMKERGVNIVALNASYGGGGNSSAERAAIQTAGNAGIILIAAAGNDSANNDLAANYPANYRLSNMIVVAASNQSDGLAGFSNYGATKVDLAAPGTNILSTEPAAITIKVGATSYDSNAMTYSGTTTGLNGAIIDCGIGNTSDFPASVRGNIALIERGTLTFATKVQNAMAAGATAALIYNNDLTDPDRGFLGTLGTAGSWIPTRSLSRADGLAIKAALPANGSLLVAAGYQYLEGTSMATPHVTGAVAFAAMNFPNETVTARVQRILNSVDVKSGLSGKVATNGRLNLLRSVDANSNGVGDWFESSGTNPPNITTTTLDPGAVSAAYSNAVTATGGTTPYTWTLLSGSLPGGLTLSTAGVLQGTPTTSGSFSFAVQVKDAVNARSAKFVTINIASTPLAVTSASELPTGTVNAPYSATLTAIGGTAPYSWSITSGALPAGLSLSSSGALTGTPTEMGTFTFVGEVADVDSVKASKSCIINIDPLPLNITTASPLTVGSMDVPYAKTLAVIGGVAPHAWSISAGTLPPGLSLSNDGIISGQATAAGTFEFAALVTDSGSRTLSKSFVVQVEETAVVITSPSPLVSGVKSQAYSGSFAATGGTAPYTWSLAGGTFPAGMIFSTNGSLSGTPTQFGIFHFTIAATDAIGFVATQEFDLTVTATYVKPVVNPINFGVATIGVPFTHTVTATNYPKSFSITGLPSGVTYKTATGVISGRPAISGIFNVQVKATNPGGTSAVVPATLVVNALPAGFVGSFTGIIARDPIANANLGSRLTLTTTKTGYYTVRVTTGVSARSAVGYLAAAAPHIRVTIGTSLLSLTLDAATQLVAGTHGTATVSGWRSTWTTKAPAATRVGYYTVGLDLADAGDDGVSDIPQGSGYAAFTVTPTGTLTVTGKAADGSAFTSAGFLGPNGEIAIYTSLYANLGSLVGILGLTEDANKTFLENTCSGVLTWLKPKNLSRTYGAGFGPIHVRAFGKYLSSSSTRPIASGLPAAGSASLLFTDGGLASAAIDPDVASFTYAPAKPAVMPTAGSAANPAKATLTINGYSGLVGGAFTLVETSPALTRRVTFQGMIVREPTGNPKAVGYFLLPQIPTAGQTIATSPIWSGGVAIEQTPAVE